MQTVSALPRHCYLRDPVAFKKLLDISLMHLVGHPEIAVRIKLFFFSKKQYSQLRLQAAPLGLAIT